MSSGTRLRDAGQRRSPSVRSRLTKDGIIAHSLGVSNGEHGENRLNLQQVYALENMFQSNPAVQAARTVLSGQLLSGGISLRKNGSDVDLTSSFKDHLNEVWLPFAQDVIDCFLKWGHVVISYEEHFDDLRHAALMSKRRRVDADQSQRRVKSKKDVAQVPVDPVVIVPIVPQLGTYEIAYRMGGRQGYKREYIVYSSHPGTATREDEEARVIVKQHPDQVGNVNSPLASVFELGSFVSALMELALVAESSRARPRMVTQMRKKDASALDPGNLFFDSESRAVLTGADADESATQARALQMQQKMCDVINRLQTKQYGPDHHMTSFGGASSSMAGGKTTYAPPEVTPTLFNLPKVRYIRTSFAVPQNITMVVRIAIVVDSHCVWRPSNCRTTKSHPVSPAPSRAATLSRSHDCPSNSSAPPSVCRRISSSVVDLRESQLHSTFPATRTHTLCLV